MFTTRLISTMMSARKVIGTHNGTFHCDESLAVFMLKQTAAYKDSGSVQSFYLNLIPHYH